MFSHKAAQTEVQSLTLALLYLLLRKEGNLIKEKILYCTTFITKLCIWAYKNDNSLNEPPRGKTNNLHRRKQRRRSASR